jgi:hypothetical protein
MRHQKDGWSCGYIVEWWFVHQHALIASGAALLENPPHPPPGWNAAVWLMLEARDAAANNSKSTPFDLGHLPHRPVAFVGLPFRVFFLATDDFNESASVS